MKRSGRKSPSKPINAKVADDSDLPEGYEAYTANPNFEAIYRPDTTPPVWDDDKTAIYWLQKFPDETHHLMSLKPETQLEWQDAREFMRVYYWRSWRTPDELKQLVAGTGPWVVRLSNWGYPGWMIRKEIGAKLLQMKELDREWFKGDEEQLTGELSLAGHYTAEEALHIARLADSSLDDEATPEDRNYCFEPILPKLASKDVRCLHLRTSGWGPQVGRWYDGQAFQDTFHPQVPMQRPVKHPFLRVPDAWVALLDAGEALDQISFPTSRILEWRSDCPRCNSENLDADCNCMPREMRQAQKVILCHMFVRFGQSGPYQYLGLGHLPEGWHYDGSAAFEPAPAISVETARSFKTDLAWQAWIEDESGETEFIPRRVASPCDLAPCLEALDHMEHGTLHLRRWGPTELRVRVFEKCCYVRYLARGYEQTNDQFLYDTEYAGPKAEAVEPSSCRPEEIVAARTVFSREIIADLLNAFISEDGKLPWMPRWTNEPFGKEKKTEENAEN